MPLYIKRNTPEYKNALYYIKKRGLLPEEIIRYNIGYCETGDYSGRIIIPSYDSNGILNYFVGRNFYDNGMSYKNPEISKDIIGFELFVNWNEPIILVEGVFDAIAVRRNAIPLFGKTIPKKLLLEILRKKPPKIYIALDKDAIKSSIEIAKKFIGEGHEIYLVELGQKDPSVIGYNNITELINLCEPITEFDLMKFKMKL